MMRDARRHLVYEVTRRAERGESRRGIARALGIAPKTVRKILRDEAKRREMGESAVEREAPPTRTPRASKLDPYEERIAAWLERYDDLTAVRLHELLQDAGFTGGYTIVLDRMRELRKSEDPKDRVEVVTTLPGQQSQFDWSPYRIAEGALRVEVWSCTLSWSRARSFLSSDNQKQTTILNYLKASFDRFGGVPAEGVTDTMSGVVDGWECGLPILNVRFVDFAAYYRFAVHVSPRRTPRYKGKVERPFDYLEKNLLNGRTFPSREAFAEELAWWQDNKAMERPHPETGRPIREMLEEERPYLKPLPARPYDTRDVVFRFVDVYANVLIEGNFYPVPDPLIGQMVYVCIAPDRIEILDRGVHRVAEWERVPDGAGIRVPDPSRSRKTRYDLTLLVERMTEWGPEAEQFAKQLRVHRRCPGPELHHILGLQLQWSADDIVKALGHAMRYDAYEARAVERILETRFKPRRLSEQIAESTRRRIRDLMKDHPVAQRPLSSYETLRTGDRWPGGPEEEEPDADLTGGDHQP